MTINDILDQNELERLTNLEVEAIKFKNVKNKTIDVIENLLVGKNISSKDLFNPNSNSRRTRTNNTNNSTTTTLDDNPSNSITTTTLDNDQYRSRTRERINVIDNIENNTKLIVKEVSNSTKEVSDSAIDVGVWFMSAIGGTTSDASKWVYRKSIEYALWFIPDNVKKGFWKTIYILEDGLFIFAALFLPGYFDNIIKSYIGLMVITVILVYYLKLRQ